MIRFAQAIERAHRFALWHRNKLTDPDKERFREDWKTFTMTLKRRGEQWAEDEYSIMLTYAMAALRYDPPNHGTTPSEWRKGGLWSPQWGAFAADREDETEEAAA